MTQPTVAIVGASADRSKYGNKAIRAHLQLGYRVFPINPRGGEIEGLTVYKSLSDVPERPLTRITFYVPPLVGLDVLDEAAEVGCQELWLNPGSESEAMVEKATYLGLEPIVACSIIDLGVSPASFADR